MSENLISLMRKRWMLGVSLSSRFNRTNCGLWSVSTVNLDNPIKKSVNYS